MLEHFLLQNSLESKFLSEFLSFLLSAFIDFLLCVKHSTWKKEQKNNNTLTVLKDPTGEGKTLGKLIVCL